MTVVAALWLGAAVGHDAVTLRRTGCSLRSLALLRDHPSTDVPRAERSSLLRDQAIGETSSGMFFRLMRLLNTQYVHDW